MPSSSTKRVAKNTIIMFIRMVFLMCISFVSSRLLLKTLGVEDYGIYSVVGSVTSAFVALRSLFSESIQRFLNYYKGKDDLESERDVFSISLKIHLLLAVLFVLILEVVGLWLINNKLVFPVEKYDTVVFVFQMTVIASVFSILCIPYDAVIIANEKMGFYAIMSIFDGVFRLLVVLLLPILPFVALKAFSLSLIFIPILLLVVSIAYCKKFTECDYSLSRRNYPLFREILSLSGWNFFGNISFSLLHEGINFILNVFGGLTYNAARAIAYQVKNIAVQFSNNSLIAVRPMIMQSAALDEDNSILFRNILEISRLSFMILLIPIAPIEAFCSELLDIWLLEVPSNAVLFTRLVLLSVLFRAFHEPFNMLYMSVGKIKRMMIIEVIIMTATLLCIYLFLSNGAPLWLSFVLLSIMELLIVVSLLINAIDEIQFTGRLYLKKVLLPMALLFISNEIVVWLFSLIKPTNIYATLGLCLCVVAIVSCIIYLFLNTTERNIIRGFIRPSVAKVLSSKHK